LTLLLFISFNLKSQSLKWGDFNDCDLNKMNIDPNMDVDCDNCFQIRDSCHLESLIEWDWTSLPKIVNEDSILECITYPKEAEQYQISGNVIVRFIVDKEGNIFCYKILTELGDCFIKETERIIHLIKFNIAKVGERPIAHEYRTTIKFMPTLTK